jgi:hypothetical protein
MAYKEFTSSLLKPDKLMKNSIRKNMASQEAFSF